MIEADLKYILYIHNTQHVAVKKQKTQFHLFLS